MRINNKLGKVSLLGLAFILMSTTLGFAKSNEYKFKVYNNTNHSYIILVSLSRILDYVFLYLVNPSCMLLIQSLLATGN